MSNFAFLAHLLLAKYADHLPLYRQEAIYAPNWSSAHKLDTGALGTRAVVHMEPLTAA
jgi:transposase